MSVYRKLHLYDVCIPEKNIDLKESDMVECGDEIVPPVATPAGQLALSIVSLFKLTKLNSSILNIKIVL